MRLWLRNFVSRANGYLGNPLEWQSSSKAVLLGAITAIIYLHYALLAEFLLRQGGDSQFIDPAYLVTQVGWFYGFALASLVLSLLWFAAGRLWGDSAWFEYLAALYFSLSLSYFSYQIGTLSLPVGAVMVGAPVVGFIFFNRRAVMLALSVAMLVQLVLSFGAGWGWWPYAPVFQQGPQQLVAPSAYTVFHLCLYTFPHMGFLIVISYMVLSRWREREEKVRLLSITDPLTGLLNRRSILSHLEQEQERSRLKGPVLSVLMVDLDHFKAINDERGHQAGDFALIAAADALQRSLRQNDRVGRYGGEEFLIILPGTDLAGARTIAERCRQHLEATQVILEQGERIQLTGSFGLVCNEGHVHMAVDEILRRVDQAMYRAKASGRNRIVVDHHR